MSLSEAKFMSDLCTSVSPPARAVRVTPRRGAALLFLSASSSENRLLPHMWHGGCRVQKGEKVIVQQFKSLPSPGAAVELHPGWSGWEPPAGMHAPETKRYT